MLQTEGMMICMRTVRGFGCGNGMASDPREKIHPMELNDEIAALFATVGRPTHLAVHVFAKKKLVASAAHKFL